MFVFLGRLEDPVALRTFLLTLGALLFEVAHKALSGHLDELAGVTWDKLLGARIEMIIEVASAQWQAWTLVWARDHAL